MTKFSAPVDDGLPAVSSQVSIQKRKRSGFSGSELKVRTQPRWAALCGMAKTPPRAST
jgi:hypothetical protein